MALYFDENQYEGEYEGSVLQFLEGAIESWETEVDFDCEESEIKDQVRRFAQLLLSSCYDTEKISELVSVFRYLMMEIPEAQECDSPTWVEYGEHELAKESVGMLAIASGRVWKLLACLFILKEAGLNDRVLKYLRRVFRCYIWGFDPECIIMCRSVIEKAVEDVVPFELCEEVLGPGKGRDKDRWYTLHDRLFIAKKQGLISKEQSDLIYVIKEKGDKAVHHATWLIKDVLQTIQDASKILAVLTESGE